MSQSTQGIAPVMFEGNHLPQDNEVAPLHRSRVSVTKCFEPSMGVWFLRLQAAGHFSRSVVFPSSGCSLCGETHGPGEAVCRGSGKFRARLDGFCLIGARCLLRVAASSWPAVAAAAVDVAASSVPTVAAAAVDVAASSVPTVAAAAVDVAASSVPTVAAAVNSAIPTLRRHSACLQLRRGSRSICRYLERTRSHHLMLLPERKHGPQRR